MAKTEFSGLTVPEFEAECEIKPIRAYRTLHIRGQFETPYQLTATVETRGYTGSRQQRLNCVLPMLPLVHRTRSYARGE